MAIRLSKKLRKPSRRVGSRLAAGLLVIVPIFATFLVVGWLFRLTLRLLEPVVTRVLSIWTTFDWIDSIPKSYVKASAAIVSFLVMFLLIYVLGFISQYVLGKKFISAWERILLRIPVVRSVYGAAKQVTEAVSLPNSTAFKTVVLLEFPRPGFKSLGFLTGYVEDNKHVRWAKVFIPTSPNPTTGFFELVAPDECEPANLSTEEAFKMIISGGIVCPARPLGASEPESQMASEDEGDREEPSPEDS